MSAQEAVTPAAAAKPAPALSQIRFLGSEAAYWRLLIRGAFLLLCTLGIYRFWLTTDMRRFLWGYTEIAGNHLEYTGTAMELVVGFLIAIAILMPLNILFFLAALDLGLLGQLSGVLAFGLLALLGQFALYRARRYRLSRTIYRGVRFYQTGSAWLYALRAVLWWSVTALTLGLAYPWAQASLESFKMRHTYYGDLGERFEGSGLSLFLRGIWLWLLVVGPFALCLIAAAATIDWPALTEAVSEGGSGLATRIEDGNPQFATAIIFIISAVVWSALAAAALYPAFQALMLRWWSSGLRFGELSVTSRLRTGDIYKAYVRFVLFGMLLGLGLTILSVVGAGVVATFKQFNFSEEATEFLTAAGLVLGYVVLALGYSTIYQVTVKLSLWHYGMESAQISGIAALDKVKAAGRPTSALGEGLADALQVGGI